MNNFDTAFKKVIELVEDFKQNEKRYLSPEYQEAEVRRDFIDKFFETLGWDIYHNTQKNPYEQEVKVEKGVSIGKAQKRADYAFYITPEFRQPKFYAEAKKPSRNLKNADDYFQTIRYGWSAKTPVAVLTDFEEFHVLDCRFKPNIKNVLDNQYHKSYSYSDYISEDKFKEIYFLFSRNSVQSGSLEKYSDSLPKPKGKKGETAKAIFKAIDDDFLEYIDGVRERLAKAFKKIDSNLSSEELTEATQRTIDRIVFIRFLEDKLIEPEYIISEFGKRGNPWNDFITVSRKLDAKYNGIVFKKHFIDEQNFSGPEVKEFSKICEDISHLNSPYDFNAIPIHILGSIYERFLGKVVNATAQRVKVEEKPEVRKAGGVYYTPKYIVDYIVENTVGALLRGEKEKPPAEISKLRFADIACGSGSFLIGVFDTLLKYYSEYYQQHPIEAKKDGCIEKDGKWILSIKQKQNILLNNIYGVDIDSQAVEVTQLSLALKMLEDESTATANDMQVLFHEKILPDLSKNIVCGNSLIGTDILSGNMFASDAGSLPWQEERKLNPMDFETMFPHIFKPTSSTPNTSVIPAEGNKNTSGSVIPAKAGIQSEHGFDAIVGNPPYFNISNLDKLNIKYFEKIYSEIHTGYNDIMYYFIYKSISLLNENGIIGLITSNYYLGNKYALPLRKFLNKHLLKIINFKDILIFHNVNIHTSIVIANKKNKDEEVIFLEPENIISDKNNLEKFFSSVIKKRALLSNDWIIAQNYEIDLIDKINEYEKLENLAIIEKGSTSGKNEVFTVSKEVATNRSFESKILRKNIKNGDITKYKIIDRGQVLIYIDSKTNPKDFPNIYNYLIENKEILKDRNEVRKNIYPWYRLERPRNKLVFDASEKIVVPYRAESNKFAYDNEQYFNDGGDIRALILKDTNINLKYVLGILNSKLMDWYYGFIGKPKGKSREYFNEPLGKIPIKTINFQIQSEKHSHDLIVSLVDQMLESKKQLHTAKTDKDKTYYERKCENLDKQIDAEVYKLYGLTEEEIKIVEGKE